MFDIFDDELEQMFSDGKHDKQQKLNVAFSLHDPINLLPKYKFVSMTDDSPLIDVINKLQQYSMGCVLLENDNKISGIFTERDAMKKVLGQRLDLNNEIISKYMTPNPECLRLEDPIAFALNKMVSGGFRHVPLINNKRNPLGVLSMQSIINHLGEFFFDEIVNLPPKPIRGETSREGG
ncbi:MAG: CBS domain-containing protein [Candidatus Marinimicrobia bacterium]|nr:CBS domain-containing protein [Candidatus Neomarinimicrobiota bacterium]